MKRQGLVVVLDGELGTHKGLRLQHVLGLGSQLQGVADWLFDAERCIPLCAR